MPTLRKKTVLQTQDFMPKYTTEKKINQTNSFFFGKDKIDKLLARVREKEDSNL